MSFPRYPAYKDSGLEWLGEVPEHWDTTVLKRLANLRSGETINSSCIEEEGPYRVYGGNGLRGYTSAFTHEGHFALIGRQGALCGNVNYADGRFWASEHAVVVTPQVPLSTRWLGELLRAMNLNQYSISAAQPGLSVEALSNLRIPKPPYWEQIGISAFLDCETAKIDNLVEDYRALIELLKEKRQATISHAVTKGLDPTVPMKDSGVEWLGEVPEHWSVVQSRRLFSVRNEPARESDQQLTASQKYGVIPQIEFVEREGRKVVEMIIGKDSLRHAEQGDFVISLRSFEGGIEWCRVSGSVTFHYVILIPSKIVVGRFFFYLFKSVNYIQALRSTTNLIRDGQDMRWSHFVQVDLPVLPIDEQEQIALFLDNEITKMDALVADAEQAIALLQERRTALISAAVTGMIDVRGLVVEPNG